MQACELGNLGGFVNVSMMYSKGDGIDKNPVAAKELVLVMIEDFMIWMLCAGTGTLLQR